VKSPRIKKDRGRSTHEKGRQRKRGVNAFGKKKGKSTKRLRRESNYQPLGGGSKLAKQNKKKEEGDEGGHKSQCCEKETFKRSFSHGS